MKPKAKGLSIGAGVILLGSMANSIGNDALEIGPEQDVEIAQCQGTDVNALQDIVARYGMVLTIGSLQMLLGNAVSADDIDAVTAPSMKHR